VNAVLCITANRTANVRFVISGTNDFNHLDCQMGLTARIERKRLLAKVSNRFLAFAFPLVGFLDMPFQ
jgi:hypothetical protein